MCLWCACIILKINCSYIILKINMHNTKNKHVLLHYKYWLANQFNVTLHNFETLSAIYTEVSKTGVIPHMLLAFTAMCVTFSELVIFTLKHRNILPQFVIKLFIVCKLSNAG